jgi:hypothetical protein
VIDFTYESDGDDGEVSWHRKASGRHAIKLTYLGEQYHGRSTQSCSRRLCGRRRRRFGGRWAGPPSLTSPFSARLLSRSLNVPQEFIESLLVRIRKIALIE